MFDPFKTVIKFVGVSQNSSPIFGNLRLCSEIVQKRSCGLRTSFEESLEIFGKWSEIFGKSSNISLLSSMSM